MGKRNWQGKPQNNKRSLSTSLTLTIPCSCSVTTTLLTMTDQMTTLKSPSSAPTSGVGSATGGGASLEDELNALLSSPDFTVASYLNRALASGPTTVSASAEATSSATSAATRSSLLVGQHPDESQRRMAELALQLQIETQQCHEDIGRIGAELQAILPRCAADVGRVGVGLEGMRMDAQSLLESTAMAGEEELSSSLETLSTLHALQNNLTKTKEVLTAAATWDATISSVAPLLSESNLTEAVNALAQLESGERALRGMPHREERQKSIQEIRQQVQRMLQPQLQHALQNMHTRLAPLQQCVSLYSKLGKMDSLQEEYVKQRPGALHKAWFSYAPKTYGSNSGGGGEGMASSDEVAAAQQAGQAFLTWLPNWYEQVLNLLTEERRQASTVFGSAEAPVILVKVNEISSAVLRIVLNSDLSLPPLLPFILCCCRCYVKRFVPSSPVFKADWRLYSLRLQLRQLVDPLRRLGRCTNQHCDFCLWHMS